NVALGQFAFTIAGINGADAATVDVTVTGPGRVTPNCGDSFLTPQSQTNIAQGGGTFQSILTPGTGCWFWNSSNVPAYVTGVPASGAGPTTISYTLSANGSPSIRSAGIVFGYETRDSAGLNPQPASGTTTLSVSQLGGSCSYALT